MAIKLSVLAALLPAIRAFSTSPVPSLVAFTVPGGATIYADQSVGTHEFQEIDGRTYFMGPTVNLYDPNPKPSKPLHTSTVAAKADYGSYRPVDPRTEYCSHQGQLTDFLLDEAWPLGFSEQCMCDKCNIVHCKWATVVYVQRFEDIVDVHKLGMCGPNSPYECASRIECRPVLCEQVEEQSNSIAVEAQAQAEADLTEEVPAATSTPSEPEGSSLPADRIAIRSSIETVTQVVEVNHFVQGRNGDTRSTTTWRSWSPWVLVSLINVLPFKAFL